MIPHLRSLVLAIPVMCLTARADVCLRFPGAPVELVQGENCRDEIADFERAGRTSQLLQDYDEFLIAQERDPRRAWREFLRSAVKKVWGPEDERLMREVITWVERQNWKKDPVLRHQLATLGSSRELELRPGRGRSAWVEAIAQIPGYEDARILAAATDSEDETQVLASPVPRRFVVYSSVYRARAFWVRGADLPARISQSASTPWGEGDCLQPEFSDIPNINREIRAYGKNGCTTANLARRDAHEHRTAVPLPPPPAEVTSAKSRWWIVAGILAASAAAYSMRDKTVVITRGFHP